MSCLVDLGSLLGAGNSDVSHPESPLTAKMPADDWGPEYPSLNLSGTVEGCPLDCRCVETCVLWPFVTFVYARQHPSEESEECVEVAT